MTTATEHDRRIAELEGMLCVQSERLRHVEEQVDAMRAEIEMWRNRRPLRVVNSDELATV